MCRFIAYQGEPILLEALVSLPPHSLVRQSTHARQAVSPLNADGFGLGWYGRRRCPETYHSEKAAGASQDLLSICKRVRSGSFFAHVRAATDTEITRDNCHPFTCGRWLFMHNGQVGSWPLLREQVEAALPTTLRSLQRGTTDSEAIFLSAIADGLERSPVAAIERTLAKFRTLGSVAGPSGPLRFAAAVSDGHTLWAFRWACDGHPPTLYYGRQCGGIAIASEPTDKSTDWDEVPAGSCLVAKKGQAVRILPLNVVCLPQRRDLIR